MARQQGYQKHRKDGIQANDGHQRRFIVGRATQDVQTRQPGHSVTPSIDTQPWNHKEATQRSKNPALPGK